MGKRSKQKGSDFERLVAKMVLSAFGKEFTQKDCFRTPMSGGHPFADGGDLVISPRLREVFPFVVECKHDKTWRPDMFFSLTKLVTNWLNQARAEEKDERAEGRSLLLVMRGNNTDIYCVARLATIAQLRGLTNMPQLRFYERQQPFVLTLFREFLEKASKSVIL